MSDDDDVTARLDDVAKLLGLLLRKEFETPSEMAVAFHGVGIEAVRIAELTGMKVDTVRKAIQRSKQ